MEGRWGKAPSLTRKRNTLGAVEVLEARVHAGGGENRVGGRELGQSTSRCYVSNEHPGRPRRRTAGSQPRREWPTPRPSLPGSGLRRSKLRTLWMVEPISLAFPAIPSKTNYSFFFPSGLFACFGIKHTDDQTSPAKPARLVPEPAGENIVIG